MHRPIEMCPCVSDVSIRCETIRFVCSVWCSRSLLPGSRPSRAYAGSRVCQIYKSQRSSPSSAERNPGPSESDLRSCSVERQAIPCLDELASCAGRRTGGLPPVVGAAADWVERDGSATAVIWPGVGAVKRSIALVILEPEGGNSSSRARERVGLLRARRIGRRSRDAENEVTAVAEGSMVHVGIGTGYRFVAGKKAWSCSAVRARRTGPFRQAA